MSSALSSQRFCLRWNNHQSNLLSVFDQLLHDESFVDVTLAVEGRFLRAHKMVLSACSPYFQALFVGHPDKHPIVILKDVPYCDMRSLLDFMYRGEVSVDQDRLTAFLKVAESLRIKGLTEVNEEKCDLPSITSSLLSAVPPPVVTTHTPPPPHLHRIHPTSSHKRSIPMPSAPSATSSNPLLGSALTAPKRKRGRPRKLSGSSGGAPATTPGLLESATSSGSSSRHQTAVDGNGDVENSPRLSTNDSLVAQGSPELLEVKMSGMEFQHSPAGNSGTARKSSDGENGSGTGPSVSSADEAKTTNKDSAAASHSKQVKEEPEPTPGPSSQGDLLHNPGQAFVRPSSTNDPEQYALGYHGCIEEQPSITFELCGDTAASPYHHSSGGGSLTIVGSDAVASSDDHKMGLVVHALSEPTPGIHFLSHEVEEDGRGCILVTKCEEADSDDILLEGGGTRGRQELLEYLIREDGSVVCKWCGEILPSRTHWYRHKYKFHVPSSGTQSPASLYKCHRCNVFFKSRKGYAGHVATRHSDEDDKGDKRREDFSNESLSTARMTEDSSSDGIVGGGGGSGSGSGGGRGGRRNTRSGTDAQGRSADYEKQREKEEKLVAEIIDRVRRECEAQGTTVTRRGYSRRSTVMNS
ncbi:protein bric-a-brac 1 isoform X2 [Periplaneta americana]|uniref:protein bric-a-brac 1 isoform X2 n=1 Tax=Periplaneta americana TaxID=6978 RepID=UPI0037E85107